MSKRGSGKVVENRETTERLLDAAERLFGEYGYDGVGMRQLAQEAQVNLGAATYHFGSKEALYTETFLRRFRPVNAERLRLLGEARAAARGKPLKVEKIVDCMVRPPFMQGLEHPNFLTLLARSLFLPPAFLHPVLHREIEPNAEVFVVALSESLGKLPVDLIRLREMFAMGTMLMFSVQMGKLIPQREPRFDEGLLQEMVHFIAAGLQCAPAVPAADRPPVPRPPKPSRK